MNIEQKDMEEKKISFSDEKISCLSKSDFKSIVQNKVRKNIILEQNKRKEGHSKVRHIVHTKKMLHRITLFLKSSQTLRAVFCLT